LGRVDEGADRGARGEGSAAGPRADRLPRARPRSLLGHIEHVHRPGLLPVRPEERRRRRRRRRNGLPEALARVRRLAEPRHRRPGRHSLLRPDATHGGSPARVESCRGRPHRNDRAHRRFDRIALGTADRRLRPRRCGRAGTPEEMTPRLWLLAASLFLVVSLVVGALVGPVHIGLVEALQSAAARIPFLHVSSPLPPTDDAILWDIRVPRVVVGALVGAMLATAGASYQGVFRNPLADPYLLGVAAGAGLGATLAVVYLRGIDFQNTLPPAAFAGGAVAVVAAYAIGRSASAGPGGAAPGLAGRAVAAFFTAVQTFVQQQHS